MNLPMIATLDLNLLRVFQVMMEERNVTRTGERLGLTQSAVSHALNRLRTALDDELFLRSAEGMRPTPWACESGPKISQALWQIQQALEPIDFAPQDSNRLFNICTTPYVSAILLPKVVARCRNEAPHIEFALQLWNRSMVEHLDSGQIDLAVGALPTASERYASEPLFDERMVWVMSLNHPLLDEARRGRLRADRNLVIISAGDTSGLEGLGGPPAAASRCEAVSMSAPDSHSAIAIAARSDVIALAPSRLARSYAGQLPIALVEPPQDAQALHIRSVWRRDHGEHPALSWLRAVFREESVKC